MSTEDNIKTVVSVYEAFGRGDVGAILDAVTDDVDWATETTATTAPWWGVRHGKQEVAAFFQALAETSDVTEFEPLSFAGNDTDVMAVIRFNATARATGKSTPMHLHHYFKFRDGKIAYYRGTEDTAITAAALTP
jgi:uncharacterized protein